MVLLRQLVWGTESFCSGVELHLGFALAVVAGRFFSMCSSVSFQLSLFARVIEDFSFHALAPLLEEDFY